MLSFLTLAAALELGILPIGDVMLNRASPHYADADLHTYAVPQTDVWLWDVLYVGGTITTYQHFRPELRDFYIHTIQFDTHAGIRLDNVTVGWRHVCLHPVIPYQNTEPYPQVVGEGAREEVFLRFETRFEK